MPSLSGRVGEIITHDRVDEWNTRTPPDTMKVEGLEKALKYYDDNTIGDPDRKAGPILEAARRYLAMQAGK